MTVTPGDFLDAAHEIETGDRISCQEMQTRTAAGRAYYSAFLAVRQVIRSEAGDPGLRVKHTQAAKWLKEQGTGAVSTIGTKLQDMRVLREKCDYELRAHVHQYDLVVQFENVDRVLGSIPENEQAIFVAYVEGKRDHEAWVKSRQL